MTFTNKKDNAFIVTCDCGCGHGLHWEAWTWDDADEKYYLALVEPSWYAKQGSRVKSYFKRLWKALRGKEYCLSEIILKKADVQEFTALLTRLTEQAAKEAISEGIG